MPIPRAPVSIVTAPDDPAPTSSNGQTTSGQPTTEDGSAPARQRAEHMRDLMSSYRTGTLRGRSEAARDTEPITPEWRAVSVDPTRTEDHPEEGA